METNLRPLTLGEILDRTAQLYRTNFLLFAGIFSIYAAVGLVVNLLQLGLGYWFKAAHMQTSKIMWVTGSIAFVEWLLLVLLIGAAVAAISRAVAQLHLGESASIRGAYASTLPRLGRYLWLMTVTGFRAFLPVVLLYGALIGTLFYYKIGFTNPGQGAAATPAQQQALIAMGIVFLVFAVLFIPVIIYTIWMGLRYSLATPACVIEDIKALPAIRRSIELSKGARGRIFLLFLLIGVIKLGIGLVTQSFVFVAAFKHHGQVSIGMNILSQIMQFFTNTFLGPIGATGVTLVYFDQRVRNEGYDIEWMMQAAGMSPAELTQAAPLEQASETGPAIETAAPVETSNEVAEYAPADAAAAPEAGGDGERA